MVSTFNFFTGQNIQIFDIITDSIPVNIFTSTKGSFCGSWFVHQVYQLTPNVFVAICFCCCKKEIKTNMNFAPKKWKRSILYMIQAQSNVQTFESSYFGGKKKNKTKLNKSDFCLVSGYFFFCFKSFRASTAVGILYLERFYKI